MGINFAAQCRQIRSPCEPACDLHGKECRSHERHAYRISFDEGRDEIRREDRKRRTGTDLILDGGAVDAGVSDCVKIGWANGAAEFDKVAIVGDELGVEECGG